MEPGDGGRSADQRVLRAAGRFLRFRDAGRDRSQVLRAAYEIIERKGATYYGIGLGIRSVVEAMLRDQNTVLTVSTLMAGQLDVADICLSLPCVVDRGGVEGVLVPTMSDEERAAYLRSARVCCRRRRERQDCDYGRRTNDRRRKRLRRSSFVLVGEVACAPSSNVSVAASVIVDGQVVGEAIGRGFLVLLGVTHNDGRLRGRLAGAQDCRAAHLRR